MVSVVLGMLFCVALALAVMALVAVPARRQGRDVLSERGEDIVGSLRERQLPLGRADRDDDASVLGEARFDEPVAARG
ncbi:MAG TPA: hypothetical protein VFI44_00640 [Ornithinibacter sp.]|nr:hypothetical protein [Ornithinibacter sp.]